MGPWLRAIVESGDAEARGDAAGALDVMERMPEGPDGKPFWRPWRAAHLFQIVVLGPLLPRWATSRWILNQAMVPLNASHRVRVRRALDLAVELRGGMELLPGVDEFDAQGRICDRDWVYRQLLLYDLGALDHFLRTAASPDLVAGADSIRDWARASMGGYRLVGSRPAETTWLDLASGEQHRTPNIGSAALDRPGDHVIGRLVPIEQGGMFETGPLRVPERVARQVADAPAAWLDALRDARAEGVVVSSGLHPECLVSDVPSRVWLPVVLPGFELPSGTDQQVRAADLARSLLDVAAQELEARAGPPADRAVDPWPCLAAALLEPDVLVALLDLVGRSDDEVLRHLSGLVAEPAAGVCRAVLEHRRRAA